MGGREFQRDIRSGTLGHGNPAQYDYAAIDGYLKGADADTLKGISRAYAMAHQALQKVEQGLPAHINRLNSVWKGDAQELGLEDLRRLTKAAGALATASQQFQTAMNSGVVALKTSQFGMPNRTPLGVFPPPDPIQAAATKQADDRVAQQHLAETNSKLVSSFSQIPDSITLDLPKDKQDGERFGGGSPEGGRSGSPTPGGGGSTHGGRGSVPGGNTPSPGNVAPPSPGDVNPPGGSPEPGHGGAGPGGHSGNPSDLQGVPPNGPGPGIPGPIGPGPGGGPPAPGTIPPGTLPPGGGSLPVLPPGGGLPSRPPVGPQPGMGGPRPLPPGGIRPGPGGTVPGIPPGNVGPIRPGGVIGGPALGGGRPSLTGSPGEATGNSRLTSRGVIGKGSFVGEEAESIAARNAAGRAGLGLPMGSAGAGHGEQEREREVWLVEDDDLWAEDDDVAPRVIGD